MDNGVPVGPDQGEWLSLTELTDVLPLEPRLGDTAPQSVPDPLVKPLFGPDDASARTFAIVDPHRFGDMSALDVHPAARRRSLYTGKDVTEFSDAAPHLLELEPDDVLTAKFFAHVPGFPPGADLHFWARNSAVYLRSTSDFDAVFRHLRHFTRLSDAQGRWFVRRFWDAEHLLDWLPVLTEDLTVAARFFGHLRDGPGPVIQSILVPSPPDQSCLIARWTGAALPAADLPANRSQPLDAGYREGGCNGRPSV